MYSNAAPAINITKLMAAKKNRIKTTNLNLTLKPNLIIPKSMKAQINAMAKNPPKATYKFKLPPKPFLLCF
jgi:hypothetical protein